MSTTSETSTQIKMEYTNAIVALPNFMARALSIEDSKYVCEQSTEVAANKTEVTLPIWVTLLTILFALNEHWQLESSRNNADNMYQSFKTDSNIAASSKSFEEAWDRTVGPCVKETEVVAIDKDSSTPPKFHVFVSHAQMEEIALYHLSKCKAFPSSLALVGQPAKQGAVDLHEEDIFSENMNNYYVE
ncbi:MAG: hypothetical protein Q9221_008865 [Calogaya cf. arnoldii]